MIRTVREMLRGAESILTPRLNDHRFSGVELDQVNVALTAIVSALLQVQPDELVAVTDRVGVAAVLRDQLTIIVAIDTAHSLTPGEIYNATDLMLSAADAIEAGEPSAEVTL